MSIKMLCGECGNRDLVRRNMKGLVKTACKDFPLIHLTTDLKLWHCHECGNTPYEGADSVRVDAAFEANVRDQASQFIDIIRSKVGLPSKSWPASSVCPGNTFRVFTRKKDAVFHRVERPQGDRDRSQVDDREVQLVFP